MIIDADRIVDILDLKAKTVDDDGYHLDNVGEDGFPEESSAVIICCINQYGQVEMKTFGEGDAKIILDAFVDDAR